MREQDNIFDPNMTISMELLELVCKMQTAGQRVASRTRLVGAEEYKRLNPNSA